MATFLQSLAPSLPSASQAGARIFQYIHKLEEILVRQSHSTMAVAPVAAHPQSDVAGEPPTTSMMPQEQPHPHLPPQQSLLEQYALPNTAFYNFQTGFIGNMWTNAFNDSADIDWASAIESWGTT
ncbi:uncharacterized protein LY79DRAFT_525315 [Colletotrichum navitas]|uniref:Uncharacterized protein n=1 Tax=Colletotrichum navitas TaxID=681940 RepID=A0AAD8V0W8_9PEZI|nr:uncharacterized protein LY79DRAFT_525315 [Colletotrichum navitas]KAK1573689.1 hypothetical protein LY79DRAFT_525315 [Colletotrichum navitas]